MGSLRDPSAPQSDAGGQWSRYWRSGALHSCTCAFGGNYAGAIARFWDEQCDALPDGAVVVDLGTGNGAIPLLLKEAGRRRQRAFAIHGVDLADIAPPAVAADGASLFEGIEFHPRTSMDRLPFGDGAVDLVTGQYALEYADADPAVREIARVLGGRGRAAFVLHSDDSRIAATTTEQLALFEFLFGESGLYPAARAMAALLGEADTAARRAALAGDAQAQAARQQLNAAADAVVERIEAATTPDVLQAALQQVRDALQLAQRGRAPALAALEQGEAALRDESRRLQDLRAAALSAPRMEALRARFQALGYGDSSFGQLRHEDGSVLGWALRVR